MLKYDVMVLSNSRYAVRYRSPNPYGLRIPAKC